MNQLINKSRKWIRTLPYIISVQLFVTLCALPFLVAWGLPLSALTILGNIFFTPFLSVFLCISTLIFFCELLHIPNAWLCTVLDRVTQYWMYLLSCGPEYMISFACPHPALLIMPIVGALLILQHTQIHTPITRMGALLVLTSITCGGLYWYGTHRRVAFQVARSQNSALVIHNKTTVLVLKKTRAFASNARFITQLLLPQIIKQTGHRVLEHVVIVTPNLKTIAFLRQLHDCLPIQNIYLAIHRDAKKERRIHKACASFCAQYHISLHPYPHSIVLTDNCHVTFTDKQIICDLDTRHIYNLE